MSVRRPMRADERALIEAALPGRHATPVLLSDALGAGLLLGALSGFLLFGFVMLVWAGTVELLFGGSVAPQVRAAGPVILVVAALWEVSFAVLFVRSALGDAAAARARREVLLADLGAGEVEETTHRIVDGFCAEETEHATLVYVLLTATGLVLRAVHHDSACWEDTSPLADGRDPRQAAWMPSSDWTVVATPSGAFLFDDTFSGPPAPVRTGIGSIPVTALPDHGARLDAPFERLYDAWGPAAGR
jgi:hypothetical protein